MSTTKTVKAESLPFAEQIVVIEGAEQRVATAHRVQGGVKLLFGKGGGREVRCSERVNYTRELPAEGVATCTTEGHGPKAQRPGGIWFCRACYREQQKQYRQRKGAPAATRLTVKAQERTEMVDRLLLIAPKPLVELRAKLLIGIARATFFTDEAKAQRLAEVGRELGLTPEQVAEIVAA